MKITKRILSAFLALSLTAGISFPVANAYDFIPEADIVSEKTASDMDSIAAEIRKHLVSRDTEFEISIPFELLEEVSNIKKMLSLAVKDTPESSPVEGDYLAWTTGKSNFGFSPDMTTGCYITTFNMSYRTTAEQEAELDDKVAEILAELNVGSANDYEKIKAVHDYVISHVTYNLNGSDLKYSAYGAAIEGEAVCQGYSLLMYRLLSELNINVRLIPGTANGGGHMWNLVELYGKYYYIDATFDDGVNNKYAYFLKGSEDFDSYDSKALPHVFDTTNFTSSLYADYSDGDFLARFDISPTAFDPSAPVVTAPPVTTVKTTSTVPVTTTVTTIVTPAVPEYSLGDIDSDGIVSATDASIVLRAYSLLSTERDSGLTDEQKKSADVNSDGRIDSSDSSIILSYYSFLSAGGYATFEEYILTLDE